MITITDERLIELLNSAEANSVIYTGTEIESTYLERIAILRELLALREQNKKLGGYLIDLLEGRCIPIGVIDLKKLEEKK